MCVIYIADPSTSLKRGSPWLGCSVIVCWSRILENSQIEEPDSRFLATTNRDGGSYLYPYLQKIYRIEHLLTIIQRGRDLLTHNLFILFPSVRHVVAGGPHLASPFLPAVTCHVVGPHLVSPSPLLPRVVR